MPHQLTQAQSDHLATAQREADRTLHEEYRNAFVKVHKLQQLLEAIVKFCVNRGEESRSLEAWKKAYIKFIEGTSMREVVLKGFEEHIGLVRESVGNGKRLIRSGRIKAEFAPQLDLPREAECRRHLVSRDVLLSISGFIEVQMKAKRAPYEGGPLTVLRDPLRNWFSKIKDDLFTSNVEFENVRPARKYWLKLYHEILVLFHLVHLGEPIMIEGHAAPLFGTDRIPHRLSEWTPPAYLDQPENLIALQLGKFHPVARSQLGPVNRF